ncbi:unnamed protein product [Pedinophyceae sp. YPF-701]|nr:unnamed protein product [Pedinophyceae sp. YPF-701]
MSMAAQGSVTRAQLAGRLQGRVPAGRVGPAVPRALPAGEPEHSAGPAAGAPTSISVQMTRRATLGAAAGAVPAIGLLNSLAVPSAEANTVLSNEWELVDLPIDPAVVLLDIFMKDDKNGFLVGTRQTLLRTTDGGNTWEKLSVPALAEEGFNYRFNSVSFIGDEGWIVGKPAVLLHTTDGGATWDRVPLSSKLPGVPMHIYSTGKGEAEMVTDQGAIYVTGDVGATWKAQVQETVDATLNRTVSSGISGASYYEGTFSNVARNDDGSYVAVSSRGNFFMTWAPGETYWQPHNRPMTRRVQTMGYSPEGKLWLTTRGGDVLFADSPGVTEAFSQSKLGSRGFGVLDVGFRPASQDVFACGGSGTLLKSKDGGKTFKRDRSADTVPANLYEVRFFSPKCGFILGNNAKVMRFIGGGSA